MGKPAYLDSMLFFKIFLIVIKYTWASLMAQMVQNLSVIWETCVWILDWEDPLEEDMVTHLFLLENPQGQRSLVGYSPWGQKEADTTKWLSTAYKDFFFLHVDHFSSLYWICSITCFMFQCFGHEACEISAPWPGVEHAPPIFEGKILTTGPPGKSHIVTILKSMTQWH